jgi:hypothetical protein
LAEWEVVSSPAPEHFRLDDSGLDLEMSDEENVPAVPNIAALCEVTAEQSGLGYARLGLYLDDGSVLGFVPVQVSPSGLLLVALPRDIISAKDVGKSPSGEPNVGEVPSYGLGRRRGPEVTVVLTVWDEDFFEASRVYEWDGVELSGGGKAFGRDGTRWPESAALLALAQDLGYAGDSYQTADEPLEIPAGLPTPRAPAKAKGKAARPAGASPKDTGGQDARIDRLEKQLAEAVGLLRTQAGRGGAAADSPRDHLTPTKARTGVGSAAKRGLGAVPRLDSPGGLRAARAKFGGPGIQEVPKPPRKKVAAALRKLGPTRLPPPRTRARPRRRRKRRTRKPKRRCPGGGADAARQRL